MGMWLAWRDAFGFWAVLGISGHGVETAWMMLAGCILGCLYMISLGFCFFLFISIFFWFSVVGVMLRHCGGAEFHGVGGTARGTT